MAAQTVTVRRSKSHRRASVGTLREQLEIDRDDQLQSELKPKLQRKKILSGLRTPSSLKSASIEQPIANAAEALMGKMPKHDRIIKRSTLMKLTQSLEWKPMDVAITSAGVFLAKPNQEYLRDLIPLCEIIDVRKKREVSTLTGGNLRADSLRLSSENDPQKPVKKISSLVDSTVDSKLYLIQIRTSLDGCNSGRTYYFDALNEELCDEWLRLLKSEVDRAVLSRQAGPSSFKKFRFRLHRVYSGFIAQSAVALLILASFFVSIVQNEYYAGSAEESYNDIFNGFEYFFTCAFAFELLINMTANLFRPFFKVKSRLP